MLVKNVTDALILPHTGISMYTGQSFLPFFFVQHGQVSTLNIIEYQDHLSSFAKIALLFFVSSVVSFVLLSLPCTFVIDLIFAVCGGLHPFVFSGGGFLFLCHWWCGFLRASCPFCILG